MKLPWRRIPNRSSNHHYNVDEDNFITCARSSLDAAQMDEPEIIRLTHEMRTLRLRNHFAQLFCVTPEETIK